MSHQLNPELAPNQSLLYQIRLQGHLESQWAERFAGLTLTLEANGESLLTGQVTDQAALHGLLRKVRDLGLPLLAVTRIQPNQVDAPAMKNQNSHPTHPVRAEKSFSPGGNTMNSTNLTARLTGFLYLLIAIFSAFGLIYVPSVVVVAGDAAATAHNLVASESLFRLGFFSNLLTFTINVFVAVLLYKLLKPVHQGSAAVMVILISLGLSIAMLNELNQLIALWLVSGADYLSAFTTEQLQALATLFLNVYQGGFSIAHIFWGLWLFPLGYLVFKSGFLPRFIGIMLIVAGIGYLVDFTIFCLFPQIDLKVSVYTFIGEPMLILWLLVMGVNVERWQQRVLASA